MLKLLDKYEKPLLCFAAASMLLLIFEKYASFFGISCSLQWVIAVISYLMIASDVIISAFKTLFKQHRMSEQFLMMIATLGAFGLSDLPEALAVMVFYKVGQLFEDYASGRARGEISSLLSLKPDKVRIVDNDGKESIVKPKTVKIGNIIRVFRGELIAIDGILLEESAAIDTKSLTGESEPRLYKKGEVVPSGCINQGGMINLKVNTTSRNSSITKLLNMIEDSAAAKSHPEDLIRRFALWYTPIVVTLSVILSLVPVVIADALFSEWIPRALVFLVVSCPCALVLSVPLSFFGGLGALSKMGVIVKGTIHLETLSKLKAVCFDKTGTLTEGSFKVVKINPVCCTQTELLRTACAIESKSTHPVAMSIVSKAKDAGIQISDVTEVFERAGYGIEALYEGHAVACGRADFIESLLKDKQKIEGEKGSSCVFVCKDGEYMGYIELSDEPKADASDAICSLNLKGLRTALISGDRKDVVDRIGQSLKIQEIFSEQTPADKIETFKNLKKRYSPCAYTGDGLNDAPVLAMADVGIAMGDIGSQCAIEAADVVIMNDRLSSVPKAVSVAKRTYALAMQNLCFVMGVKLLILILGALGIAGIWLAIFGDVGVLVLAVLNAMRSLKFR